MGRREDKRTMIAMDNLCVLKHYAVALYSVIYNVLHSYVLVHEIKGLYDNKPIVFYYNTVYIVSVER